MAEVRAAATQRLLLVAEIRRGLRTVSVGRQPYVLREVGWSPPRPRG